MMWFLAILAVLVLGGVAAVAAGKGAPLAEEFGDRPDALVPADGDLTGTDLRRVRFPLVLRGYRMAEVDALLDRLATQLDDLEPRPPGATPTGQQSGQQSGPVAGQAGSPEADSAP